ncbi:MAG: hypothetical protein KF726_07435 [Anaerolineae bacterium]|nr:hypothetical protein [Anaerolineae bacterium]
MSEAPVDSVITLTEFKSAQVQLSQREVAHLATFAGRAQLTLQPTTTPDNYLIKPAQFVGLIPLPGGRTLHIHPKVPLASVLAMLNYAADLAMVLPDSSPQQTFDQLIQLLIEVFLSATERIIAGGLLRSIETRHSDDLTIRGRLNLSETLRRPTSLRLVSESSDVTVDIRENRLLKLACHLLLRHQQHYRRARRLLDQLLPVTLDHHANELPITLTSRNAHYREALELAALLIEGCYLGGLPGKQSFVGFLVDMNRLFERYVIALLRHLPDATVSVQATLSLDAEGQIKVRPDAILTTSSGQRLPVDAKYKTESVNNDIYQALAYCRALNCAQAWLIYPRSDPHDPAHTRYRLPQTDNHDETVIHVLALDLVSSVTILESSPLFLSVLLKT